VQGVIDIAISKLMRIIESENHQLERMAEETEEARRKRSLCAPSVSSVSVVVNLCHGKLKGIPL
jgi:hypothetical protein